MKDTRFIHACWAGALAIGAMFGSAAYVGTTQREAAVRLAELAVEHTEERAVLCEAYATWRGHQDYRGPDLMKGMCATDPEIYAEEKP